MFGGQLRANSKKTKRVISARSGHKQNIGNPQEGGRLFIMSIVQWILLYGAPTWASKFAYDPLNVKTSARVQRQTSIRSACAYRKISYKVVQVFAWTHRIVRMAVEHASVYYAIKSMLPVADGRPSRIPVMSGHLLIAITMDEWTRKVAR